MSRTPCSVIGPLPDWRAALGEIASAMRPHRGAGRVATYIPALARVDPHQFGIALATCDGKLAEADDATTNFSIQSISKVLTLTLALQCEGESLWSRLGREPSGSAFNSVVQLEAERGIPRNPFINAGALVITDVVVERFGVEGAMRAILELARKLSGNASVAFDREVAASEAATGHRNASLAHFMKSFGNLRSSVRDVLHVYFHQCSLAMNCVDLARSMLWLANDGVQPETGERIVDDALTRRINAIMLTCGHYDAAGDFAYRVGLPGKSGVGGGIVVIVPSRLTVAVWSPGLNEAGSSEVGTLALEEFANRSGLAIF